MDVHPLSKQDPVGGQPPGQPVQFTLDQARAVLMEQVKRSANWFFFIGGLSLVNSIIQLLGADISFIVGLVYTQFVNAFAELAVEEYGLNSFAVLGFALFLNVLICGVFAGFGYLGRNGARWAFIVGMILYVIDGLIFLSFGDILPVLFHGYALFNLFRGVQALGHVDKIDRQLKAAMPY